MPIARASKATDHELRQHIACDRGQEGILIVSDAEDSAPQEVIIDDFLDVNF